LDRLVPLLKPKDVVVIFSNGGFDGIHGKLLERLGALKG
jgi:UDP-N-acetylmuramate: L-alanyl-gamma-D-glutamyl-meso-diaminopimelate ligase